MPILRRKRQNAFFRITAFDMNIRAIRVGSGQRKKFSKERTLPKPLPQLSLLRYLKNASRFPVSAFFVRLAWWCFPNDFVNDIMMMSKAHAWDRLTKRLLIKQPGNQALICAIDQPKNGRNFHAKAQKTSGWRKPGATRKCLASASDPTSESCRMPEKSSLTPKNFCLRAQVALFLARKVKTEYDSSIRSGETYPETRQS